MLMLPVAMVATEATLATLVLVVIIIIPGMVLMLDPELLPVLVMKELESMLLEFMPPLTLEALDVFITLPGLELMPALELLVPPPDIRPVDIPVSPVAIPSDMPCSAAFASPKLFGARV